MRILRVNYANLIVFCAILLFVIIAVNPHGFNIGFSSSGGNIAVNAIFRRFKDLFCTNLYQLLFYGLCALKNRRTFLAQGMAANVVGISNECSQKWRIF